MSSLRIVFGAAVIATVMQGSYCQSTGSCVQLNTCDKCISGDASLNITKCLWLQCDSGNSSCVEKSEAPEGCSLFNDTGKCSGEPSPTSGGLSPSSDAPAPTEPEPVYSQPNFNLASFIGGIILVLGIQSAIFFVMRFFKSRDSTYQTLI
ncbi:CD164 sialomucin-like 2 protein isoform X2 [Polypterus senegalus]|uniref:CD164 sialomucin-like 2 protein isoform X2 n=1 Tax=Polypterus senegalus TaxID=55291 RepID=UPI001966A2D3|nr:CD164 sialomucin-like 2 protein isoform X2 [Polypterus senegalus]